jgi:chromosomal replication initiator protein
LRVHLQATLEHRTIDSVFVDQDICIQEPEREAVSLEEIIGLVEHTFGVSRVDLISKSRKGTITWARQVAMFLARSYTLHPLQEIGRAFGRDHATVIHAFQKVMDTMEKQPPRRFEVDFLKKKLQARGGRTQMQLCARNPSS